MSDRNAVILVDHRNRDLMGATLIAHHLEKRGVRCHLEPLESYRSCLAAYAPDLILFNHLISSHLVAFSKRLRELNVLTAVLPNEGILYDPGQLKYNAGHYHKGAFIDLFFCWNEIHRAAIRHENPSVSDTRLEVVGVPRFDFYFEPWSRLFPERPRQGRPRLLLCTNFAFARYENLSDEDAHRFFEPFQRMDLYRDYKTNIRMAVRGRDKMFVFLEKLASSGLFDIVLRPHPREVPAYYQERLEALPEPARSRIELDSSSMIHELIRNCDLELSCETCTTAIEAWIVGKPTVELVFDRHPTFFHEEQAEPNLLCDDPEKIVEIVQENLAAPEQATFQESRRRFLARWCSTPAGTSSEKVASVLAEAIHAKGPTRKDFTLAERRRGMKLKLLRRLNQPYNFAPLLDIKYRLFPRDYSTKKIVFLKTIRPSDVAAARQRLAKVVQQA